MYTALFAYFAQYTNCFIDIAVTYTIQTMASNNGCHENTLMIVIFSARSYVSYYPVTNFISVLIQAFPPVFNRSFRNVD